MRLRREGAFVFEALPVLPGARGGLTMVHGELRWSGIDWIERMADDPLDSTREVTLTTRREYIFRAPGEEGKALLIVLSGARVGHRLVLGDEPCTIGRGSASTLQFEGDAVSRLHARIECRGGAHFLVDCQSTNGSFVNYKRIKEAKLNDGDQIQIGHALCKYLSGTNIEAAYHEQFRRLVRRDALTGALNRATFDEEFRVALASNQPGQLCLILFDLDHFKAINDTHGHTAGDLVLSEMGQRVSDLVETPHQFARVGGEEFAVLFFGGLEKAQTLAEAIRRSVAARPARFEGKNIRVTASLGVAAWTGGTAASVYEAADKLLYKAKEAGRDRVE